MRRSGSAFRSLTLMLAAALLLAVGAGAGHLGRPGYPLPEAGDSVVSAPGLPDRPAEGTLLDEVGRLAQPVGGAEAGQWRQELKTGRPVPGRAAWLHLWLGEWALAGEEAPQQAAWHFRMAQRLASPEEPAHGLAAYDLAVTRFLSGEYSAAAREFHRLLAGKDRLTGYDPRLCGAPRPQRPVRGGAAGAPGPSLWGRRPGCLPPRARPAVRPEDGAGCLPRDRLWEQHRRPDWDREVRPSDGDRASGKETGSGSAAATPCLSQHLVCLWWCLTGRSAFQVEATAGLVQALPPEH
jgi:hypothetical protein